MRLTCLQKDLANALLVTSKAVDGNNTLPVLNNVHLKAQDKTLYFTATNLEMTITFHIEADVQEAGEVTVPAKMFTSYINYLKDQKVDITVEGADVHLKTSDSKTNIKGIAASEFPPVPEVENEGGFKLSAGILKQAIGQVVFAAAMNTTRPILGGVYFSIDDSLLRMASTDSYRLSEKTLSVHSVTGQVTCVVPARTVMELGAILDNVNSGDEMDVVVAKNQIQFKVGVVTLVSCLIEGQFPNYKQIIPESSKTQLEFTVSELGLVMKRINIFARENNNKVIFRVKDGQVLVTTESTQYGDGEIVLSPIIHGEDNEIALNSQFLLESLSHVGSSHVLVEMGEKTSPVVLKPKEAKDYVHIIMPLKI